MDFSQKSVDELVDLIDNQPLRGDELAAANAELEAALEAQTARDALNDLASYVELTEGARGRALEGDVETLTRFLDDVLREAGHQS